MYIYIYYIQYTYIMYKQSSNRKNYIRGTLMSKKKKKKASQIMQFKLLQIQSKSLITYLYTYYVTSYKAFDFFDSQKNLKFANQMSETTNMIITQI